MRRLLPLFLVLCLLPACSGANDSGTARKAASQPTSDAFDGFCPVNDDEAKAIVAKMTLKEKAAQLFMVGVAGRPHWMPRHAKRLIRDLGVGGVFLQPVKTIAMGDGSRTARTVARFQEMALSRDPAVPLLFALDQEGGIPQAFQSLFGGTDGPGNLALAAAGDPKLTYAAYSVMAREVRALGANVALAPVLDRMTSHKLRPMYTRTFGQTVEMVNEHAAPAVRGFQDHGVAACIKHYPGGGGAFDDPHYSQPVTGETEDEIRRNHLRPFDIALAAGADMVMIGQIRFAAFDEKVPAAFSKKIKLGLLREEAGFDGVMLTDDMGMGAITGRNDLKDGEQAGIDWGEDVNVLSIRTGSDMILYVDGVDADRIEGYIDAIVDAVKDGRLTEERIDESVMRILKLKQKYCLFRAPCPDPDKAAAVASSPGHVRTMKDAIAAGITLVRNEEKLWPLPRWDTRRMLVVSPMKWMFRDPGTTFANATGTTLGDEIEKLRGNVDTLHYMPGGMEWLMERAAAKAKKSGAEIIVLATYNAHYDPKQIEMARAILGLGKPTIVVSLGTPYELMDLPGAKTYLCIYNMRTLALETAAEALFGLQRPTGRLPVELEGLAPIGHSALPEASKTP